MTSPTVFAYRLKALKMSDMVCSKVQNSKVKSMCAASSIKFLGFQGTYIVLILEKF